MSTIQQTKEVVVINSKDNGLSFGWDPVLKRFRCPIGKEPERYVKSESLSKTTHKSWYPAAECDKCIYQAECRGKSGQKVYQVVEDHEQIDGVETVSEFFERFPYAASQQAMIEFSYDIDLFLLGRVKTRTFEIGRSEYECKRMLSFLNRCRIVYTDGSHKDGSRCSSYVMIDCHNNVVHKSISCRDVGADSYISELVAAIAVLNDLCKSTDIDFCEIRSDNSAVVSLGNGLSDPKLEFPYTVELKKAIQKAKRHGLEVVFVKVKGHSGEMGNTLADFSAGWARRYHPTNIVSIWDMMSSDDLLCVEDGVAPEVWNTPEDNESPTSKPLNAAKGNDTSVQTTALVALQEAGNDTAGVASAPFNIEFDHDGKEPIKSGTEKTENPGSSAQTAKKATLEKSSKKEEKTATVCNRKELLKSSPKSFFALGYIKTKRYFKSGSKALELFMGQIKSSDRIGTQNGSFIIYWTKDQAEASGFREAKNPG